MSFAKPTVLELNGRLDQVYARMEELANEPHCQEYDDLDDETAELIDAIAKTKVKEDLAARRAAELLRLHANRQ